MATLHAEDGQRMAYIKGSVEKVLAMCSGIGMAGEELPITDEAREAVLAANRSMASQALRVLAIAVAPYPVELGKLGPGQPGRPSCPHRSCRDDRPAP